jgi:hypothetical protein
MKSGLKPAFYVFGDEVSADGFLGIRLVTLSEILLL